MNTKRAIAVALKKVIKSINYKLIIQLITDKEKEKENGSNY